MTKTSYTGEEVRAMLKERGILHQDAAAKLGILPQNFSARLHGNFTDVEVQQTGILPTLIFDEWPLEKDLKTIIQYYWPEFITAIKDFDYEYAFEDIVQAIKKDHCRTIEVWDYKGD